MYRSGKLEKKVADNRPGVPLPFPLYIEAPFSMSADSTTFERHYRFGELAKLWSLGRETVRKLVKDDPGVIKIRMGRKRAHTVYSVPESAAKRIHTRLLNGA
jgi:hypothetical protein